MYGELGKKLLWPGLDSSAGSFKEPPKAKSMAGCLPQIQIGYIPDTGQCVTLIQLTTDWLAYIQTI
jgi:hypothetical protein